MNSQQKQDEESADIRQTTLSEYLRDFVFPAPN